MLLSIHQPMFFPWLGLLDKVAKSEVFVFLNDVQANKGINQNRNTFFCNGEAKYLTLPVDYRLGIKINELQFKNDLWVDDHLNKLTNYYRKAPYFDEIYPLVSDLYFTNRNLTPYEFIKQTMLFLFDVLEIRVEMLESSDFNCVRSKGELVLEICQKAKTDIYLSGMGALNYMTDDTLKQFEDAGIKVVWHSFTHPVYNQLAVREFVEGLSSLDLLFFEGISNARKIFWTNVKSSL